MQSASERPKIIPKGGNWLSCFFWSITGTPFGCVSQLHDKFLVIWLLSGGATLWPFRLCAFCSLEALLAGLLSPVLTSTLLSTDCLVFVVEGMLRPQIIASTVDIDSYARCWLNWSSVDLRHSK